MTPETIFSIANTMVLPGWLLLIIVPRWKYTFPIVFYFIISVLAISYSFILVPKLGAMPMDSFSSLEGISALFQNKEALLAGWIHYLAFDLLVGMGIAHDSNKHEINKFLVIPCMFFTFMAGPFGLVLYIILRAITLKKAKLVN